MKKWIAVLVVVAAAAGTWWYVRTSVRVNMPWNEPKFGEVSRGDIEVPITAPGVIEAQQRIEVKSKASGEVIEILIVEGKFVHAGDVLVRLKPDDEERGRDRAKSELARANALRAQAEVAIKRAEAGLISAEARLEQLQAQGVITKYDLGKIIGYRVRGEVYSEQELITAQARHDVNLAEQKAAAASIVTAKSTIDEARETVKLQQAAVEIAEKSLADAEERLAETTIVSKYDAIVTDVGVRESEVIQGGQTTFNVGTVIARLAVVSKLKVLARVDEADYGRIHEIAPAEARPEMPGAAEAGRETADELAQHSGKVRITVDAFPEEEFEGVIERVEPQGKLNPGSSVIQFDVHVAITDPKSHMLPLGAQAQVEFTVESAKDVMRVPSEAVKSHEGDRGVWVRTEPEPGSGDRYGKKFIPYRFGITDGAHTQVIAPKGSAKPLEEKQQVYTKLPQKPNEEG